MTGVALRASCLSRQDRESRREAFSQLAQSRFSMRTPLERQWSYRGALPRRCRRGLFDFLTAAAAIAELASMELMIDKVHVDGKGAGSPEMKASRACPCDSPAVKKRA